jgi:spermidine synthase
MTSIEVSEKQGVRMLHFGSSLVQGAMRIARPWSLELAYTRDMMFPLLLNARPEWPLRVLQIGLGCASVTKFLHRHRPEARITVVEILPEVVGVARQYFKLPGESQRLRIEIGDGCDYVAASRRKFDLILVDGFDAEGRPGMLDTVPFHLNVRQRLSAGGMASYNLLTGRHGPAKSVERLREAYEDHVLVLPRCEAGNTVAIAASGAIPRPPDDELHAAALRLKSETGLDLAPTVAYLRARSPGP